MSALAQQVVVRPRRLRRTASIRRLVAETRLDRRDLVLPVFVRAGIDEPVEIASMPGVLQHTPSTLERTVEQAARAGIGGVMVFGVPQDGDKDASGSAALDPDGVLARTLRRTSAAVGDELVVMSDLCLDEYTDHGHCGVVSAGGEVDNDATVEAYAAMALVHAASGAHVLGLSGMMDGQVRAVREALDRAGHTSVAIAAYAAKYASAFYGPFREAVACSLGGDRRTYQMDGANAVEAIREVALDVAEGADLVVVKPASSYLDVVHAVARTASVPVAAYQVSGEYSMVEAAAARGWIDRRAAIVESLLAVRRAGASVVLTYWALEAARLLEEQR